MTEYAKAKQVEAWLRDSLYIRAGIESLKQEYDSIKNIGSGLDISKESSSKTNKFNSEVENIVIKTDELRNRIVANEILIEKLDKALDLLNEDERKVITHRCIYNEYYYQFTNEIYKSEITCKRIKKEAIRKMTIAIFGLQDDTFLIRCS